MAVNVERFDDISQIVGRCPDVTTVEACPSYMLAASLVSLCRRSDDKPLRWELVPVTGNPTNVADASPRTLMEWRAVWGEGTLSFANLHQTVLLLRRESGRVSMKHVVMPSADSSLSEKAEAVGKLFDGVLSEQLVLAIARSLNPNVTDVWILNSLKDTHFTILPISREEI